MTTAIIIAVVILSALGALGAVGAHYEAAALRLAKTICRREFTTTSISRVSKPLVVLARFFRFFLGTPALGIMALTRRTPFERRAVVGWLAYTMLAQRGLCQEHLSVFDRAAMRWVSCYGFGES